jgi:hypothetical protein
LATVPAVVGGEGLNCPEIGKQFSPIDEFEYEIEVPRVLRKSLKINNKGMLYLGMDDGLIMNVVDLLSLNNLALFEKFECHEFTRLLRPGDLYLTEAPYDIKTGIPRPMVRPNS